MIASAAETFVNVIFAAGTNCVIFRDRFDVVTYTDLVAPMRMLFIYRQPPLAYVANVFYLPFSTRVWVTIAVCTAIATVTIVLASKWEVVLTKVKIFISRLEKLDLNNLDFFSKFGLPGNKCMIL